MDSQTMELQKLARTHTVDAVNVIVEIMKNEKNEPGVRLRAADIVLERGHGKPYQPHTGSDGEPLDLQNITTEALFELYAKVGGQLPKLPDAGADTRAN